VLSFDITARCLTTFLSCSRYGTSRSRCIGRGSCSSICYNSTLAVVVVVVFLVVVIVVVARGLKESWWVKAWHLVAVNSRLSCSSYGISRSRCIGRGVVVVFVVVVIIVAARALKASWWVKTWHLVAVNLHSTCSNVTW